MKKNKFSGAWYGYALKKTFRIMRIAIFFLLIGILQSFANDAWSQRTRLSLDYENARLADVLNEIEDNSEFFFLYNEKLVDAGRKVSISVKDKVINEVLDLLFSGTSVKYSIVDRNIVLAPEYLNSTQQGIGVSGTVTDRAGQPLPGVSVVVKGTSNGTITDISGNYSLTGIPSDAVLQFSFVGMESIDKPVLGKSRINVVLQEKAIGIEEVIAIGYGRAKRREIIGSISRIGGMKSPNSRPRQLRSPFRVWLQG